MAGWPLGREPHRHVNTDEGTSYLVPVAPLSDYLITPHHSDQRGKG